jgi:hypothetical protein
MPEGYSNMYASGSKSKLVKKATDKGTMGSATRSWRDGKAKELKPYRAPETPKPAPNKATPLQPYISEDTPQPKATLMPKAHVLQPAHKDKPESKPKKKDPKTRGFMNMNTKKLMGQVDI